MTKMTALLAALTAALIFGAPAQAKEITKATVWGASGSVTIDDPDDLGRLPLGAEYVTDPPVRAPWYAIDVATDAGVAEHHVLLLYVPSARRVAGMGEFDALDWGPVASKAAAMLDRVLADAEPYLRPVEWPRALKSPEQLPSFPDAAAPTPADRSLPKWTWVVAAAALSAAIAVGYVLRRRRAHVPAPRPEGA
jgi:hypothetical protein